MPAAGHHGLGSDNSRQKPTTGRSPGNAPITPGMLGCKVRGLVGLRKELNTAPRVKGPFEQLSSLPSLLPSSSSLPSSSQFLSNETETRKDGDEGGAGAGGGGQGGDASNEETEMKKDGDGGGGGGGEGRKTLKRGDREEE